jgi:cobalamin biosynthesis protein CobT
VTSKSLNDFTTTEKDKNKGVSRYPPKQFRLKEEDLIREASETQMLKAEVMDQEAFACVMDDYQGNLELRGKMYEESKVPKEYDDEEEDNEDGYTVPDPSKEPTTRMVSHL